MEVCLGAGQALDWGVLKSGVQRNLRVQSKEGPPVGGIKYRRKVGGCEDGHESFQTCLRG